MNRYFLLTLALMSIHFSTYSQSTLYTPLPAAKTIPANFPKSEQDIIDEQKQLEKTLSGKKAQEFHASVAYTVWGILNGGKVYIDGELTDYLNTVTKNVFADKPELLKQLKIYAVKSSSVNAITYPNGYIFVNTGLLAAIESEDELAFILAHEVIHYSKEHAKQIFLKDIAIDNAKEGTLNSYIDDAYRNLKYSRENEQDADASAIQLIINSKYNANKAISALEKLNVEEDTLNGYTPDIETVFNNKIFTVDTAHLTKEALKEWKDKIDKANDGDNNIFVEDDTYSTHPDIDKRVLALKEILVASEYDKNKTFATNSEGFNKIKATAVYENIYGLYKSNHYSQSLFYALRELEHSPSDPFLNLYAIKSLYMLAYLRSVNSLEDNFISNTNGNKGLTVLHAFLVKLNASEMKKLAFGYMKNQEDIMDNYEEFVIYKALLTDIYLGKEAAAAYYKNYIKKYPNGSYIKIAQNKINNTL